MLPRQYGPKHLGERKESPFPSMSHASVSILSATPSIDALSRAVDLAMMTHPLLRCVVEGTGEPGDGIVSPKREDNYILSVLWTDRKNNGGKLI